jgi:outer membrane receptor protein involved in Fe transport
MTSMLTLRRAFRFSALATLAAVAPAMLRAQQATAAKPTTADSIAKTSAQLHPVTVTATRQKTDVHDVPTPVSVLDTTAVRERTPANASDLLRELPGVDVIGVGPNQNRPSIRGQRGQRILLLEDGVRLNNSRRQQDFGELPALVDISSIERVEVVRGPASVLYGTDAIGGVINLITQQPFVRGGAPTMGGRASYQYGSSGALGKGEGALEGSAGDFAWRVGGSARRVGNYSAPKGTFGKLTLANDTEVLDGGVKDNSFNGAFSWRSATGGSAFVKAERYMADNAGFGYIPNQLLGGDATKIQIQYPHQDFQKLSAGYTRNGMKLPFADKVELTAYTQRNRRDLAQDIFIPFGPGTPAGAGVQIKTGNFTDLATVGSRLEFVKALSSVVLTYGADGFVDRSFNTDTSTQTVFGFGPPTPQGSNKSSVPNATLSSLGAFAQGSIAATDRITLIVGGRVQQVQSATKYTPGVTATIPGHTNGTGVYAANALVRLTDEWNLVATYGSGFRAPNLVERYFNGPTPEGSAYQIAAPDLKPESSVNADLGLKFRRTRVTAELSLFNNDISNGILVVPTGATQNRLPVYQNVNVGRIRTRGGEVGAGLLLDHGLALRANYSSIKSTNVLDPKIPIGDTFASKLNVAASWTVDRCWIEYAVRRNGEQKDIASGASPIGNTLPAFTVHTLRGGIRGWRIGTTHQDLTVSVNNLTNALYSEAANSSFFRPEPRRNVSLALSTSF